MITIQALLIGDFQQAEFSPAYQALCCSSEVRRTDTVSGAIRLVGDEEYFPDVIVVAASRPGQHSHAALHSLRRSLPLTPILGIQGTWCEGEPRTGTPWPGMLRIYWHQWNPRWDRELQRFLAGRLATFGLPVTATEEDRLLLPCEPATPRRGLIALDSRSFDTARMLTEACNSRGYAVVWLAERKTPCLEGVDVLLWEGRHDDFGQLDSLRGDYAGVPLVAIMDFPRVEDVRRLQAGGAAAVIARPFLLDDLFRHFDRLLATGETVEPDAGQPSRRDVA